MVLKIELNKAYCFFFLAWTRLVQFTAQVLAVVVLKSSSVNYWKFDENVNAEKQ